MKWKKKEGRKTVSFNNPRINPNSSFISVDLLIRRLAVNNTPRAKHNRDFPWNR